MLIFSQEPFELIANETNDYATKFLVTPVDLPESSMFRQWADCDADDIKAYVGSQIYMGLCSKPKIGDYWSNTGVTLVLMGPLVMSRNNYQLLSSSLNLANNNNKSPQGSSRP